MGQTSEGAAKVAALRLGLTHREYLARRDAGLKSCTKCKAWKPTHSFDVDRSRGDGRAARCIDCSRVAVRKRRTGGAPSPLAAQAARDAVRYAVKIGRLAPARSLPCLDCGGSAVEYHHHLGYARSHRLDVVALCDSCHQRRHWVDGSA